MQVQIGLRKAGALPPLPYVLFLAWRLIKPSYRGCNVWTPKSLDNVRKYKSVNGVEVAYVNSKHTPRCR